MFCQVVLPLGEWTLATVCHCLMMTCYQNQGSDQLQRVHGVLHPLRFHLFLQTVLQLYPSFFPEACHQVPASLQVYLTAPCQGLQGDLAAQMRASFLVVFAFRQGQPSEKAGPQEWWGSQQSWGSATGCCSAVGTSEKKAYFNSMRPSDAIWWHRYGSTLAQVMAWCLTAPSHYLNQCWLIISKV